MIKTSPKVKLVLGKKWILNRFKVTISMLKLALIITNFISNKRNKTLLDKILGI